nr:Atu4866 domain-containing protein [Aurantimonas aggregata]
MPLVSIAAASLVAPEAQAEMTTRQNAPAASTQTHPYVGMWVTEDRHVRHELLPNGRYDEARGTRESAYQGRYEVRGDHIDYWDDTGFTADGEFRDGVLYHSGMVFHRQE